MLGNKTEIERKKYRKLRLYEKPAKLSINTQKEREMDVIIFIYLTQFSHSIGFWVFRILLIASSHEKAQVGS